MNSILPLDQSQFTANSRTFELGRTLRSPVGSPIRFNSNQDKMLNNFQSNLNSNSTTPRGANGMNGNHNVQLNLNEMINQPNPFQEQVHGQVEAHDHHGKGGEHQPGHGHDVEGHHGHSENEYNELQIPADWDLAQKHADSRLVGIVKELHNGGSGNVCICCGYEIDRLKIPYFEDIQALSFLGSGYPCFYNFIIYCAFMLFINLATNSGFNLVTNYLGDFCRNGDINLQVIGLSLDEQKEIFERDEQICHDSWPHIFSLANKIDQPQLLFYQGVLSLITSIIHMVVLLNFRRSQRQIDIQCDVSNVTPSDYTIMVQNIPQLQDCDYQHELTQIFMEKSIDFDQEREERREENKNLKPEDQIPQDVRLIVRQVSLVYNIDEVIQLEEQLKEAIKHKQDHLQQVGKIEKSDAKLKQIDESIEKLEHTIHHLQEKIENDSQQFTGIAFVSFDSEEQKDLVLQHNITTFWQRVQTFFNNGETPGLLPNDLAWQGHQLFIDPAPEPNDVDWEFIHIKTKEQIKGRVKASVLSLIFMTGCFLLIWMISKFQGHIIETAYDRMKEGTAQPDAMQNVNRISFTISMIIVLFNKFVLGIVYHRLTDMQLISTQSQFTIKYANILSIALFLNSAIITYIVEIIGERNYYGPGGFIYTETMVFILNALFPPFVWWLDPWTIIQNFKRDKQLKLKQQGKCWVTQKQANLLMENPDYLQGKRYADIMKTMWFTFLFSPCIPLGNVFSLFNLILYYYIDQYNILRRRTIKESLSKDVSIAMINNLEACIILGAIGNYTFQLHLFNQVSIFSYCQFALGFCYCFLPTDKIVERLFPIDSLSEEINYQDATAKYFQTDYDRENPITQQKAMQSIQKTNKLQNIHHKKAQQDEFGLY